MCAAHADRRRLASKRLASTRLRRQCHTGADFSSALEGQRRGHVIVKLYTPPAATCAVHADRLWSRAACVAEFKSSRAAATASLARGRPRRVWRTMIAYGPRGDIYSKRGDVRDTHKSAATCVKDYDKYKCAEPAPAPCGPSWLAQGFRPIPGVDCGGFRTREHPRDKSGLVASRTPIQQSVSSACIPVVAPQSRRLRQLC